MSGCVCGGCAFRPWGSAITLVWSSVVAPKTTLDIAFGSLKLPAGGLSVGGVTYEKSVDLAAGGSIS